MQTAYQKQRTPFLHVCTHSFKRDVLLILLEHVIKEIVSVIGHMCTLLLVSGWIFLRLLIGIVLSRMYHPSFATKKFGVI